MYNHNKAQQSKNRVHISWDVLYYFADGLLDQLWNLQEKGVLIYTMITVIAYAMLQYWI